MGKINWLAEVEKRKDSLIKDTQEFLQINSVLNEEEASSASPFGKGIEEALQYLLHKGEADGFLTKNVDHYAGHIEHGQGEELVGILCHVDVVPEGDGWTDEPFSATIRDGKSGPKATPASRDLAYVPPPMDNKFAFSPVCSS